MQAAHGCRISDVNSALQPQSGNVSGEYGLFNFVREYEFYSLFFFPTVKERLSYSLRALILPHSCLFCTKISVCVKRCCSIDFSREITAVSSSGPEGI